MSYQHKPPMTMADLVNYLVILLPMAAFAGLFVLAAVYWPDGRYTPPEPIYKIECIKGCN
jgi:hypothetical protein